MSINHFRLPVYSNRCPGPLLRQKNCLRLCCEAKHSPSSRREILLKSTNAGVLLAVLGLPLPPGERPSNLGLSDYGGGNKQLHLCPRSKTCISTAEAANDDGHYVPPWTYNPTIGRGKKRNLSRDQAMAQLKEVVRTLTPDGYQPSIVKESPEYLYVEYKSPVGFIDDDAETIQLKSDDDFQCLAVEFYINDSRSEEQILIYVIKHDTSWGLVDYL